VVAVCRDMTSGCALGEGSAVAQIAPVPAAVSAARQTTVACENMKCDLCSKLGLGGDNHAREWCYVDPKSKVYKPEVR
jgi:hypothetical protein